jgi:uncharacterized protein
MRHLLAPLLLTCTALLFAPLAQPLSPPRKALPAPEVEVTLDWDDLLPDAEFGKEFQDTLPEHDYLGEGGMAAQQSGSFEVRKELGNRKAKIPGFIVPLSIGADGLVKEFFLVPYFGACIHVPPPPPNQIVYGKSATGFRLKTLYEPYWISGTLRAQSKGSKLGVAAYSMDVGTPVRYEY